MKARQKKLDVRRADEFGVDLSPRVTIEKTTPPPARATGRTVDNVGALADEIAALHSGTEAH
ncbi:hypothetical protein PSQ19_17715 [Devosia algicola]|uniref:Electron transfer flavoprotein subunit beta n=1 Tax=Devosia algicola TaxID=3026418 RepID=A0ABY7YN15_9HYPH|nr:hypothetical protein [Devosia algicola]WDR02424.1 hypothetical protein PSQ19_17715 [Devosia algicola]